MTDFIKNINYISNDDSVKNLNKLTNFLLKEKIVQKDIKKEKYLLELIELYGDNQLLYELKLSVAIIILKYKIPIERYKMIMKETQLCMSPFYDLYNYDIKNDRLLFKHIIDDYMCTKLRPSLNSLMELDLKIIEIIA